MVAKTPPAPAKPRPGTTAKAAPAPAKSRNNTKTTIIRAGTVLTALPSTFIPLAVDPGVSVAAPLDITPLAVDPVPLSAPLPGVIPASLPGYTTVAPAEVPQIGDNPGETVAASATGEQGSALATRYLEIKNDARESVTVWVQYYTLNDRGEWAWVSDSEPLEREIAAGTTSYIRDDRGVRIQASHVRIWAESAGGSKWEQYKETDLPLVGQDRSQKATFTYTLTDKARN